MLTFKTSGLVEPEQRSAVSWGEEGTSDLKPAHLLRFLDEGATHTCCLAVIIFILNRPMTLPFLESRLTLLKKPSIRLFPMQLEWGLVYARLQAPTWRIFLHDSNSQLPLTRGHTGHNAEVGGWLWGLLLPHLCLGDQGTPC